MVRTCCVFKIFTSKCAPSHNAVHFFNISTSKCAPNLWCFQHFDFEMCFAPRTGRTFSASERPKVIRACCVFDIFTSKLCSAPQRGAHVHHLNFETINFFYIFYFEKCFAPQRRGLFRHSNFQKCFEAEVFCYFLIWKCA